MCGGNIKFSSTVSKTFIAAMPYQGAITTSSRHWGWGANNLRSGFGFYQPFSRSPPTHFSRGDFKLSVSVTRDMLPSCRMLVYFVRKEEVVADEVKFEVLNEFQNQVYLSYIENFFIENISRAPMLKIIYLK